MDFLVNASRLVDRGLRPAPARERQKAKRFGLSYGSFEVFVQSVVLAVIVIAICVLPAVAQTARPLRVVALGDSLTAGYMLPQNEAFPAVLERALRAAHWNVTIENAGVSGDTATDGLDRLDWSVGKNVDAVILELGANDMLRGIDPSVTRTALDSILARLKARGIKVMIAGMYAAPSLGQPYVAAFQRIYPDLAKKYGAPLYPFFLKGVAGSAALSLADGLHPNARGVSVIVSAMLPAVEDFLRSVSVEAKT